MTTFITFDRVYKANGRVKSVCTACGQTIASGTSIIDLVPQETDHRCGAPSLAILQIREAPHA